MNELKQYNENTVRKHYEELTKLLISRQQTITTMESATSGQVASLITDTEGSSQIFRGAFITYANETKIQCGVPEEVIEKYSVYSLETAEAMAKASREAFGADFSIGITGTMGNVDPANEEASELGKVYMGIASEGGVVSRMVEIPPQASRLQYKLAAAEECYQFLQEVMA